MALDSATQMIRPDPDSQFRLRNCQCGSNQAVYLEVTGDKLGWIVRCMDCGAETTTRVIRHDAQLDWNQGQITGSFSTY
jgi:hypothetical protein